MMDTLFADFRYALRTLRKSPGFTTIAVLTLALGIGANTAIFSVVNGVLLRPLPYQEPDRIVMVWEKGKDGELGAVTPADFVDWRQRSRSFAQLAALNPFPNFNLTGQGDPERLSGAAVSANLFDVFGTKFTLGRSFLPEEDQPGRNHVVVLSHGLWERRFGSDPSVIGRTITLNDMPHLVVGVLPPDFRFIGQSSDFQSRSRFDVWVPLALDPAQLPLLRETHPLRVFGRLAPGVTLSRAQEDISGVARQLAQEFPKSNGDRGVHVEPLGSQVVHNVKAGLVMLQVAVGFLLLIACTNVAHLLLSHAVTRHGDFAVRIALGASAQRLYQQVSSEALLLALGGGLMGLLFAWGPIGILIRFLPTMPRIDEITLDARVGWFTFGVSIATALIFGLLSLAHQLRANVLEGLKLAGRRTTGGHSPVRDGLAVAEIALAAVLLVGALLMVQSLGQLLSVPPGFRTEGILTANVSLPGERYQTPAAAAQFRYDVLDRIRQFPGVLSAGGTAILPLSGTDNFWGFEIEHQPRPPEAAKYRPISPGYVETMGIPVKAGRAFTASDMATAPRVVLISETMKRKYFPNQEAVGRRLRLLDPTMEWRTIVGVVGDVRDEGLDRRASSEIYVPDTQTPFSVLDMTFVVRTQADPLSIVSSVREAVRSLNPDQPIYDIRTMKDVVETAIGEPRFRAVLLTGFAIAALMLACIGVYGVMAQAVAGRTREFGVRLAMGARPQDLVKLVLRQTGTLATLGLGLGLVGAALLTRVIRSLLYEVSATDPLTFMGAALVLVVVALLAGYIPARRAGRVDAVAVLRHE